MTEQRPDPDELLERVIAAQKAPEVRLDAG
jgi:hypothetical protein